MFKPKCVGDNFEMLMMILAYLVTNIHQGTNIHKSSPNLSHQHTDVTNINVTSPNGLFSLDFLIVVDFPQSWFQTFSSYYSRVMKGLKFFLLGDLVEYLIMINLVLNTRIII